MREPTAGGLEFYDKQEGRMRGGGECFSDKGFPMRVGERKRTAKSCGNMNDSSYKSEYRKKRGVGVCFACFL